MVTVAAGRTGPLSSHPATSADGWLTCPDNVAFDSKGRLWIATDSAEIAGIADGLYACDVAGEGRALTRQFFAAPKGAAVCGPIAVGLKVTSMGKQAPGASVTSTLAGTGMGWLPMRDMSDFRYQATMQSTSPPTPVARALRSVITPCDVDTIAMPRPFITRGISSLPL